MTLITLDELARGACIGVFGGLAGLTAFTLAPGTAWWLVPAAGAAAGSALTVPEIRAELRRAWPQLTEGARQARAALPAVAWQLPGVKPQQRPRKAAEGREQGQGREGTPPGHPQGPPPLMPALKSAQRVLVVGASDAGKTTLLRHMLDQRGGGLVIDPHAAPGKWGRAKVVGAGRDYETIAATLGQVVATMDRRYDEIARGVVAEGHHPKQTLVIDEWRSITRNVPGAGEQIAALLTEARKANIDLILAGHSANVKALNLEGEGDLRDGFQIVRLSKVGDERRATLDLGEGPQPYTLPGPYVEPQPAPAPRRATVAAEGVRPEVVTMRVPAPAGVTSPAPAPAVDLLDLLDGLLAESVPTASERPRDGHTAAEVSLRPYVPTVGEGHRDTRSGTLTLPRDGGELHLHLHASAEAHAPTQAAPAAPTTPPRAWQRKGPAVRRQRPAQAPQERAEELHRAYRDGGAAGKAYRALYRELGGSKDTTLAAWQEGRATRQQRSAA